MKTWDVIVIGGGIIGLSLSIALRKRGASVLVVERGEPGREASHAAGGMLVDCALETPAALQPLATASARMYPEFAYELEVESGMKVDLRDNGTILFPSEKHLHEAQATFPAANVADLEPALTGSDGPAFYLRERSVDPRALTAAALKAAKNRGVDFVSGSHVESVMLSKSGVCGIGTANRAYRAEKTVNCAGAWSGQISAGRISYEDIRAGNIDRCFIPVRPVKGQMLCLAMPSREFMRHVIRAHDVYLIPRSDGRLLVGATVEEADFDKRVDATTIKRLHAAAGALAPQLRDAKFLDNWAGLRPGTPDALPILGATETPGYYVATGHFRDGILLAPITAEVMAAVIEGRTPEHDLTAFSPARFQ